MLLARRTLQVVAFIGTLVIGAASMAVIVTQTTWFKEWLRGFIVRQADDYVNGQLSIGRLGGNLFSGVQLQDVVVTQQGLPVVAVDSIGLDFNALTLAQGHIVLDAIRLTRPVVRVVRTADGWNLANLIKARTPNPNEPTSRADLEIGEIGVSDGTLLLEGLGTDGVGTSGVDVPRRIDRLDASLGITSNARELQVRVAHVSLRASDPSFGLNGLSGVIRRTDDALSIERLAIRTEESSLSASGSLRGVGQATASTADLRVQADRLSLPEFARLIPALRGFMLQPGLTLTAQGPADRLQVTLSATERTLGALSGELELDALAPERRVRGTMALQHLDIGPLAKSTTLHSDITGQARVDLTVGADASSVRGTWQLNAGHVVVAGYEAREVAATGRLDGDRVTLDARANAYGGQATASGTVVTGAPLRLDLSGRAANVDLRDLPPALRVPGAPSQLQFAWTLAARGSQFDAGVTFDRSTLAGATIDAGTVASVRIGDRRVGAPTFTARGSVANLDVQQIGRAFAVPAIATDRFAAALTGRFDVTGTAASGDRLALDASASLVDSSMFGATWPALDVTAHVASGDARIQARGQVERLDPALVADNPAVAGAVTGDLDVDVTLRDYAAGVTPDSLAASGRVTLGPSHVADLPIDDAVLAGQYDQRAGRVEQLIVNGPDLMLRAEGPLALDDTGQSNLTVHAESSALDRLGALAGQSLTGTALVDATVTGNAPELAATGTLKGSNIGQGSTRALGLDSRFTATVPSLSLADLGVQGHAMATFLEVGGQTINELTADATWAHQSLDFEATARQGVRELAAGGSLTLHPDHREVHLRNLALRAGQVSWQTAPGGDATVRYGGDRIEVDHLDLRSGDQQMVAEGALGAAGDRLQVNVARVDVAQIEALALSSQRVTGRLSADATLTGTLNAPAVAGRFTLDQGAFQTFRFESLGGRVDYGASGVTLDVRLQQSPGAWLTAKGTAPVSLFRPTPEAMVGTHQPAGPGQAVQIALASSRIDLGIVQGFTTAVTDVVGSLQANLTVTGSGYDPHLNGRVAIEGGAFTVPDLGTAYTGLSTQLDFVDDSMTISQMNIVDDHGQPLTIGGTLGVHSRTLGAVNVQVQSTEFEVIHNELGRLKLDTDMQLTGELRKPRLVGTVDVDTGTIDVGRVLQRTTSSAYATQATTLAGGATTPASLSPGAATAPAPTLAPAISPALPPAVTPAVTPAQTAPAPSLFDALDLDVTLGIPGNLVINGRDLRPANAPVSLGDLSIAVGGMIGLKKAPGDVLRLSGDVTTERGSYIFQGRRFDILRDGRIRFTSGTEIDPILDLQARRTISGVDAIVHVRGTMRAPELSFTSNPPLEEADILSLIVFNQPINELGEGQQVSLAQRAGALAGGYLASGLAASIGNALSLDEFQIQAQGEQGGGPQVTLGEQVGDNLFFRIRQGFGAEQATEFILEYQIREYLRLQGTVAETSGGTQRNLFRRVERGGLDLIFFFSY